MNAYVDLADLVAFRPLERPVQCAYRVSPFSAKWSATVALLERELRMLRAERAVLQIDLRETDLRQDGLPRADRKARTPGVVLAFNAAKYDTALRYEVGTYDEWQDNLRAIALGLEALRAVDRYGVTTSGEQYAGWRQLTAGPGGSPTRGQALVDEHGSVAAALKAAHPDHGGDPADFADVMAYRALHSG